jgi:XXXCH domain-containing protein
VEEPGERQDGRPEYKVLKERMKADFRQIRRSARRRGSPDMELVRAFCSDARLMTEYPGKGDEYYPEFLDRVARMTAAAERGDRAALEDAVAVVRRMKKECHKRFKK